VSQKRPAAGRSRKNKKKEKKASVQGEGAVLKSGKKTEAVGPEIRHPQSEVTVERRSKRSESRVLRKRCIPSRVDCRVSSSQKKSKPELGESVKQCKKGHHHYFERSLERCRRRVIQTREEFAKRGQGSARLSHNPPSVLGGVRHFCGEARGICWAGAFSREDKI